MTKITFNELLNEYRCLLDDKTYVKVFEFYIDGGTDAEELQAILFSEEWDFMYDSRSESKQRWPTFGRTKMGTNPMSQDYIDRMDNKRTGLGVSPLTQNGYNPDETSREFCEAIIKNSPKYKDLEAK